MKLDFIIETPRDIEKLQANLITDLSCIVGSSDFITERTGLFAECSGLFTELTSLFAECSGLFAEHTLVFSERTRLFS